MMPFVLGMHVYCLFVFRVSNRKCNPCIYIIGNEQRFATCTRFVMIMVRLSHFHFHVYRWKVDDVVCRSKICRHAYEPEVRHFSTFRPLKVKIGRRNLFKISWNSTSLKSFLQGMMRIQVKWPVLDITFQREI